MKYYHIIYNSSEKPMDGGVGFGIRTATEGTPESLLKAIREIKFFTDDWESYEVKPTPAQMKENPAVIEQIPKNYAVTSLTDEQGKTYFIVARRAYVGFDYGFYKNGNPTRPGNYVIDYYVFETVPERSVYEILYEDALSGSNHFIPKSVQPTVDNEEMALISVGSQSPLAIEDKPFNANLQDGLSKDVVKLFFYYLQAKKNNKKLLVRASRQNSVRIMADFYRMLTPNLAAQIHTYVNLRSQGTNDYFDIYIIHEDYPHQIYTALYDYVELESAEMPKSIEADNYANDMTNFVSSSFECNKDDVDDLLKWLSMPEYDAVKNMSKATKDAFFHYCIQPNNFSYNSLKNVNGTFNDELIQILCPYTKRSPENAARFNVVVTDTMNEAVPNSVINLIKDFNALEKAGFVLDDIITGVKAKVCSVFLTNVEVFKKLLDEVGYENVKKFFVKSTFVSLSNYLDSRCLDKYMPQLYRWFYTDKELEHKPDCLLRFLERGIDKDVMILLVDDVYSNPEDKVDFFIKEVLEKNKKPFRDIWGYLEHYLKSSTERRDFCTIFESRITDSEYAPLFYYSIKKNKHEYNSVEKIDKLHDCLSRNAALMKLVETGFANDGIYDAFYRLVDEKCDENPPAFHEYVKNYVLDPFNIKSPKWEILYTYIDLMVNPDGSKIKDLGVNAIPSIYNTIVEHKNKKVFALLLKSFLSLAQNGKIDVESFSKNIQEMDATQKCEEILSGINSGNKVRVEMAGFIMKRILDKPFAEAIEIIDELKFSPVQKDAILTEYYAKEYKAYKIKGKIKNVLKAVVSVFSKKEKDDEANHKSKSDKKSPSSKKSK